MSKLKQWVGVRKGVSQKATSALTVLHRDSQKASNYAGLSKKYRPKTDDAETYPPESKNVVLVGEQVLQSAQEVETDWWDVIATCERGNQEAKADLVVDGEVLVKDASVPLLLFLDKRIKDLTVFVEKLPTLDPNEVWEKDANGDLYRTDKQTTHRTAKEQVAIVLYDATDHHPAQTQLITKDVLVGWWDTIKTSGALPAPRKREVLKRLDKLGRGIKFAVEQANDTEVKQQHIGDALFSWLLK